MATLAVPPNKQMNRTSNEGRGELIDAFVRVLRVAPSFLVLSIIAALATYWLGVPAKERAIAAAVPLIFLFLISRAMILMLPEPPKQQIPRPPLTLKILAFAMFMGAFVSLDLVFSSAVFSLLGFSDLTREALNVAFISGLASSLTLLLAVFYIIQVVIGADIKSLLLAGMWKALSCPTILADRMFMPHRSAC